MNRKSLIHRLKSAADNLGQRSVTQQALVDQPQQVKEHVGKPTARTIMGSIYYTSNAAMARLEEEQAAKDQKAQALEAKREERARKKEETEADKAARAEAAAAKKTQKSAEKANKKGKKKKGKKAAPQPVLPQSG